MASSGGHWKKGGFSAGGGGGGAATNPASRDGSAGVTPLKNAGWKNANFTGSTAYASYNLGPGQGYVGVTATVGQSGKISDIKVGKVSPTTKRGDLSNPVSVSKLPYPEEAAWRSGIRPKPVKPRGRPPGSKNKPKV